MVEYVHVADGAHKRCPSCGAEVLPAARVCRSCRHRFDGSQGGVEREPVPGTLVPPPRERTSLGRVPPIAWILAGTAVMGTLIALVLSSGGDERSGRNDGASSSATDAIILSGVELESRLNDQLESQSSDPVSHVSCPDRDLSSGDLVDCTVAFASGRRQEIAVSVAGSEETPRLDISLP